MASETTMKTQALDFGLSPLPILTRDTAPGLPIRAWEWQAWSSASRYAIDVRHERGRSRACLLSAAGAVTAVP